MSEHMLHILAPSRFDNVGAIVGDYVALHALRDAINDAILSGTGGTFLMQSDGEGYSLAIVQAPDMFPVCTTYAGEISPKRSKRETVGLRAMPRFMEAVRKSYASGWVEKKTRPQVFGLVEYGFGGSSHALEEGSLILDLPHSHRPGPAGTERGELDDGSYLKDRAPQS
jgi:hypothetical protein